MQNRILLRLRNRLGADHIDPCWLLTLLSLLPVETYTLDEWNEALSLAVGRKVCCPSYRILDRYLHRAILDVK